MKIVGLTGGIGSGKTTVGKIFQEFGVPVYIADNEAKKLMNTPALAIKIKKLLGEEAYVEGNLDRAYVADQVFNNSDLLQDLNAIVHPAVGSHFVQWCKKMNAPYVIKEAAILFENSSFTSNYLNILVTAPENIRMQRVLKRDATTEKKVRARMNKQWSDEKKVKLADYIIENIDLEKTRKEVQKIHVKIMGSLVNS